MIAILDYEAGNQTSVRRALDALSIPCVITDDPAVLRKAEGLIFPGVGASGQAMRRLKQSGLDRTLAEAIAQNQPLLGICLGAQILLEYSEENDTQTLGMTAGRCRRFPANLREENGDPAPVPHMGWNSVTLLRDCPLWHGIPAGAEFYFVHSYYMEVPAELALGHTFYGLDFCSLFGRDGLWGAQFHV